MRVVEIETELKKMCKNANLAALWSGMLFMPDILKVNIATAFWFIHHPFLHLMP